MSAVFPSLLAVLLTVCAIHAQDRPGGDRLAHDALEKMGRTVERAIARKKLPGGILWLEHKGIAHTGVFGNRALVPATEAMTEDSIFDAASLTKVVATTPTIMKLVEEGNYRSGREGLGIYFRVLSVYTEI